MPKTKLRIKGVRDAQQAEQKLVDICYILHHMRKYQKMWFDHYGVRNRVEREKWEERADEFLSQVLVIENEKEQTNELSNSTEVR